MSTFKALSEERVGPAAKRVGRGSVLDSHRFRFRISIVVRSVGDMLIRRIWECGEGGVIDTD